MSDNVIREKHLASLGSAVKNYVDNNLSADTVLDTTPATQNGGLWYEIQNSKPVIKIFYDGHSYSLSPTIVPVSPNLTVFPPFLDIAKDSSETATVSYLGNGTISVSGGNATYNAATKKITVPYAANGDCTVTISLSAAEGYTAATATLSVTMEEQNFVPVFFNDELITDGATVTCGNTAELYFDENFSLYLVQDGEEYNLDDEEGTDIMQRYSDRVELNLPFETAQFIARTEGYDDLHFTLIVEG